MMLARIGAILAIVIAMVTGCKSLGREQIRNIFSSDSVSVKDIDELYDQLQNTSTEPDVQEIISELPSDYVMELETKTEPAKPEIEDYHWQEESSSYVETSMETEAAERETENNREEIMTIQAKEEESTHQHKWMPITEIVHKDEVKEERWVIDIPEWTEEVTSTIPVSEEVFIRVATCRMCGAAYEDADLDIAVSACHMHIIDQHDNACGYGLENSYYATRQIGSQQVVEYVVHPEVGHTEMVTIKAAYDEIITTGYKCFCGEIK